MRRWRSSSNGRPAPRKADGKCPPAVQEAACARRSRPLYVQDNGAGRVHAPCRVTAWGPWYGRSPRRPDRAWIATGMDAIVDYLSDYAAALSFNDLPAEVVHHAKRLLIDTLGCAIGGYSSAPSKMARALAATVMSQQPATVLGSGQQTSLELATFANGVMMRYLDFNDGYTGKESGHPSDAIAAVLSPAEVAHGDGRSVITATVLAYEVFCR